jgi:uncharacterized protein (TIGR03000 family)
MFRNAITRLALPAIAIAALAVTGGPALAQHGGGHGGFGGGGFHAGGIHAGGIYHGGVGGYGYHPYSGYRAGYSNNHWDRGRSSYGFGYYPYAGYGAYPYYGSAYVPFGYGGGYYDDSGTSSYDSAYPPLSYDPAASPPVSSTGILDSNGLSPSVPTVPAEPPTGTAHLTVRLPETAELWFNGTEMTGSGAVREFNTPALVPGQTYSYEVRARWRDNGQDIDRTRTVRFTPGDSAEVLFPSGAEEKPSATVTSR